MVSICIATYNGSKFIYQQIMSILEQINTDDEIIISDDGSTDDTVKIVESINDMRIKSVKNNTNRHGCIGNFENALHFAKGEVVFLSDQDDVWFKDKYKTMLNYLKDYDLVHCNSMVTDSELNVLSDSFYSILNNGCGIIKNIKKSTYYGSHMAFKSNLLNYALPFPNTNEIGHDLWIGVIAEIVGKVKFIDKKLMCYRRNNDSFCDVFGKSSRSLFKKIKGRIIMLCYLLKFLYKFKLRDINK